MRKLLTSLVLIGALTTLVAANYSSIGQAPEGLVASSDSFGRTFDRPRGQLILAPVSADINVFLNTNPSSNALNDTIVVWAGDTLNWKSERGINKFLVTRTAATKVWNAWGPR